MGNKNIETHRKRKGDLLKSRRESLPKSKNAFFYTSGGNLFFLALFDFIYICQCFILVLISSSKFKYFVNYCSIVQKCLARAETNKTLQLSSRVIHSFVLIDFYFGISYLLKEICFTYKEIGNARTMLKYSSLNALSAYQSVH